MRPSSSPQWLCGDIPAMDSQWRSPHIITIGTNRVLVKTKIVATRLLWQENKSLRKSYEDYFIDKFKPLLNKKT